MSQQSLMGRQEPADTSAMSASNQTRSRTPAFGRPSKGAAHGLASRQGGAVGAAWGSPLRSVLLPVDDPQRVPRAA